MAICAKKGESQSRRRRGKEVTAAPGKKKADMSISYANVAKLPKTYLNVGACPPVIPAHDSKAGLFKEFLQFEIVHRLGIALAISRLWK